ncbi:energy transducer TonB [Pelagicoccus mobilis]|uniref:TonB family protein n=1 Tax=Pelagicoccus mobilis TaxID=415221 RepID=A0A934VSM5_9BACT|nr:TonB family protein [Pelagicoccus mobilis]MBK1880582.1 TonB family protein [Pelagicoccus mobilis]
MTPSRFCKSIIFTIFLLAGGSVLAMDQEMRSIEEIQVRKQTEARFPGSMRVIGIKDGSVSLVVEIDRTGALQDIFVLQSSRKAFTKSALKSLAEWEFSPARCDGQAIDSSIQIDLTFEIDQKLKWQVQSPMAASQARTHSDGSPIQTAPFNSLDQIPFPIEIVEPESSPEGQATIEFYIDESGTVRCPRFTESTSIAFGQLMLDSVNKWKFEPPMLAGVETNTMVRQVFTFEDGRLTASDLN